MLVGASEEKERENAREYSETGSEEKLNQEKGSGPAAWGRKKGVLSGPRRRRIEDKSYGRKEASGGTRSICRECLWAWRALKLFGVLLDTQPNSSNCTIADWCSSLRLSNRENSTSWSPNYSLREKKSFLMSCVDKNKNRMYRNFNYSKSLGPRLYSCTPTFTAGKPGDLHCLI